MRVMPLSPTRLHRCTVAFDLGTARTRVYLRGTGVIVDEPSVAAVDTRTGRLIAVGSRAGDMIGRTPRHIRVIRPVTGGTVTDIDMARRMLRLFLRARISGFRRYRALLRVVTCVPHDAPPLAQRALVETLNGLGAWRVELVDSLIATAVGCGLPVEEPSATMAVECGTASTHVAVLSLGAVVAAENIPAGGEAIGCTVTDFLRDRHRLVLPARELHTLHLALGADPAQKEAEAFGRDAATGVWHTVTVSAAGVREALRAQLMPVVNAISRVLRACPPDLVADLASRGMTLTGGSAILPCLDQVIADATGMTVQIADRPDLCTVAGLGAMLEGRTGADRYTRTGRQ
ncbi:rod shape-determining protein [Streptomyces olivoreticuli]